MRTVVIVLGFLLSFGCSHQSTPGTGMNPGGNPAAGGSGGGGGGNAPVFAPLNLTVTGNVVDFATQKPLTASMTMATAALVPPPNVSVTGAAFTLENVPPYSTFFLIAAGVPGYAPTYNVPTTVQGAELDGVTASTVSSTYLGQLKDAFGNGAVAGTATIFVQAVDASGKPEAGIAASALSLGTTAKGPYFLDANMQPQATVTATSSSGWMVYFGVAAGTLKLASGTGYGVTAADTPAAADSVSLIQAAVIKGGTGTTPPPTMVSFTNDIMPIFINRGCYNCHSGNGAGRRLGDLVLDDGPKNVWTALVETISPNFNETRVNLMDPPKSLVLTMPSYENPPDAHPTVVFQSSADPDYQKILAWIKAGAKLN